MKTIALISAGVALGWAAHSTWWLWHTLNVPIVGRAQWWL